MIAALVGTALIWTRTAYLRYWSPALWLLAPSASEGADRAATGPRTRFALLAAFLAIIVLQVPMAMIHAWGDPRGWPWDLYRGALTESDYRARMPGARAMVLLNAADRSWPRFWYTGFQAVGDADGVPLGAQTWEIAYHASGDLQSLRRYLAEPGCRYWAVREDMPTAREFRALGIVNDWWRPENLVVSDGTVNVYRSPAFPKDADPGRHPTAEAAPP